ncbi:MAG: LysR family transcriptional regulator [Jatrophihabitans sp.]
MLDPLLLRTFVTVVATSSFTRAGEQLGISQPTVSQHVRKLEAAAGRQLLSRDTRAVALTEDGEAMAGFARTILGAQEQAISYFTGSALRGRLRFGASDDLALTQLPRILRDFRQLHPRIDLELTVTQSGALYRRVKSGHLDMVLVKHDPAAAEPEGRLVRRDRLIWVGVEGTTIEPDRPVPLVTYHAPSHSRATALAALEKAGLTWRITCNTREVNGALAATRAGLGIAVMPESLTPPDLIPIGKRCNLPELGKIDIVLMTHPRAAKEPAAALTAAILGRPPHGLPEVRTAAVVGNRRS